MKVTGYVRITINYYKANICGVKWLLCRKDCEIQIKTLRNLICQN